MVKLKRQRTVTISAVIDMPLGMDIDLEMLILSRTNNFFNAIAMDYECSLSGGIKYAVFDGPSSVVEEEVDSED